MRKSISKRVSSRRSRRTAGRRVRRVSLRKRRSLRGRRTRRTRTKRTRNLRKGVGRKSRRSRTRRNYRRLMRGGAIEYSPLPCNDDGSTAWDSTAQVGHETCVEYGTHGAEIGTDGARALSDLNITETIKDVRLEMDQLRAAATRQAQQRSANNAERYDATAQARADAIAAAREAATTAAST